MVGPLFQNLNNMFCNKTAPHILWTMCLYGEDVHMMRAPITEVCPVVHI